MCELMTTHLAFFGLKGHLLALPMLSRSRATVQRLNALDLK